MKLPPIKAEDRFTFIARHASGKKVLDIGCADWPFTAEKVTRGSLLHQRLASCARELHGLDTSDEGIRLMRDFGINNLYVASHGESFVEAAGRQTYEVVVAGEIIEHVGDPVSFLESIRALTDDRGLLILTTINFAPIKRLPRLLWRNEVVHPDHVFYFSFSTLSRLLEQAGWEAVEWRTYWRDVSRLSRWSNRLFRHLSFIQYYADGFSLACRRKKHKSTLE